MRGTTVDASLEENEPFSCEGPTGGSVWYELPAGAQRNLVLELDADGDLDAVVDVYRRERSQVTSVTCAQTDRRGRATLDFRQAKNVSYLIRVAPLFNSVADSFTLRVVQPDQPERPPGRRLAATRRLRERRRDRQPGRRVRRQPPRRPVLPGAPRLQAAVRAGRAVRAGYELVRGRGARAPARLRRLLPLHAGAGEGGRYGVQVTAPRTRRGGLPYHVQVAGRGDDTAPGIELPNDERMSGSLRGSAADVVDLYRFEVRRPSTLDLRMRTAGSHAFNLQLLSGRGKRIACACGDSARRGSG